MKECIYRSNISWS